ncbi:MAG: VWA domain-containing protein [Gemmatimonadales bacterium]
MTLDAPVVLVVAPLVGGAVWFAAAWARRVRVRRAAQWSDETARLARGAGRWGPGGLALAAVLSVGALAGPRWGEERIVAETRGLNLVIAIDISRSMLAEDAGTSRLGRALREARRLVQDLDGDRLGLVAFAGSSYILSPLSVDGSALGLYLDALDPDVASEGGTALGPALRQGVELLRASPELADRVLVVFTDGEAHDSLPAALEAAQRLTAFGLHLILVAEGGRAPARIPMRDARGALQGYQQDADGAVIETRRRDDVLSALADAAQGTIVAAELPDQAGAVRDLVASYKRARASETRTERGRPRSWIPLLAAVAVLTLQALTRRTAALIAVALFLGSPVFAPRPARAQDVQRPRTRAEKAWDRGEPRAAAEAYLVELARRNRDDIAWYNAGTAALAAGDARTARASLSRAAASLDPDIRHRALYNLGLLAMRLAVVDSANRDPHLADAVRAYREALLLYPADSAAKWNLELAVRRRRGGGGGTRPPAGGGGAGGAPPEGGSEAGGTTGEGTGGAGLSQAQAEEILRSIGQEELRTRRERLGRTRRAAGAGVKDW